MKKILLAGAAVATAVVLMPLFSAFEAHVINVTAQIENALGVSTNSIDFGTVFPQEHLNQPLVVSLSSSFIEEDRVDDVEYFIRQKPKCAITRDNGTVLVGPTATGHVSLGPVDEVLIDCGPAPRELNTGESWGVLPSLCEYISKEDDKRPDNDGSTPSFHEPWTFVNKQLVWNDTLGYLSKLGQDTEDFWTIDLAVPCFGDYCSQDWEEFVHKINPNANPDDYTQPIENEHKIFGCDLWVEVSGVSEATSTPLTGTLTVTKVVTNDNGGDADVSDFPLFLDGVSISSGVATTTSSGLHTVSESGLFGYTATFSGDCAADGTVIVPSGGSASCTVTNNDIEPVITLVKVEDGPSEPDDFDLSIDGSVVTSGSSNGVDANVAHVIDEEVLVSGYSFTSITGLSFLGVSCPGSLGGSITLAPGDTVTCTITNTFSD